eukprot:scaffold19250_cov145-Isochrysis_galbana.AAC.4
MSARQDANLVGRGVAAQADGACVAIRFVAVEAIPLCGLCAPPPARVSQAAVLSLRVGGSGRDRHRPCPVRITPRHNPIGCRQPYPRAAVRAKGEADGAGAGCGNGVLDDRKRLEYGIHVGCLRARLVYEGKGAEVHNGADGKGRKRRLERDARALQRVEAAFEV